jgi:hypothetical protein
MRDVRTEPRDTRQLLFPETNSPFKAQCAGLGSRIWAGNEPIANQISAANKSPENGGKQYRDFPESPNFGSFQHCFKSICIVFSNIPSLARGQYRTSMDCRSMLIQKRSFYLAAILGLWTLNIATPQSRADGALEQQVKSAFVLNFLQFVDWPDTALGKAEEPLIVGVLDSAGPWESLSAALDGKTVKGHKVQVQRLSPGAVGKCQVLVTGNLDGSELETVLKSLGTTPVLTIGDSSRFTTAGGVIEFYLEDQKVRFEINLAAAQRAQLQVSAKLLKLARVVNK